MEHLGRTDINREIKSLTASLNQTGDPVRKAEIQNQINILRSNRNALISNSRLHAITHERLVVAGTVFDKTHKARLDID